MEQRKLHPFMRRWEEGVAMYRAGIHPRQEEITRALAEYLKKFPRRKDG